MKKLPGLAALTSMLLYGLHFFWGGGHARLLTDSEAYLLMAQGSHHLGAPYTSRVFGPLVASIIASVFGVSVLAAFQVLTPAVLLASLLLLRSLIRRHGGSIKWQAAILLALGCGLAATFGYTPVMVDPLMLFLTCLTITALDRAYFAVAVVLATLAALTKEYALVLGLVTLLVAYRRGHRGLAFIGVLLPTIAFLVTNLLTTPGSSGSSMSSWQGFVSAMFGYQAHVFRFRGASEYPKLLYMWSWSTLWPVIAIGAALTFSKLRSRIRMRDEEVAFLLMLLAMPLLLLGDWGRALLILVPFACIVATAHPLAREGYFAFFLAVGGLATALARPFHSEPPPPRFLPLALTVISVVSSLLIGIRIYRLVRKSTLHLDPDVRRPSPQIAVP